MPSETRLDRLFEDFPELLAADVNWDKEVYAHFGLLFSGYALLEAALQNCFVFRELKIAWDAKIVTDAIGWENRCDELEKKAFGLTFGDLIKAVEDYPEFLDLKPFLRRLKMKRNYFAHHFFREEMAHLLSEEHKPSMIAAMNDLRNSVREMEGKCQILSEAMIKEIRPTVDVQKATTQKMAIMKEELVARTRGVQPIFGWESNDAL